MSSLASILASAASQVASGTPIYKVSLPANLHISETRLNQTQRKLFSNTETLLRFNAVDSESDPIKRMGMLYSAFTNAPVEYVTDNPFNPILGEFLLNQTIINGEKYEFVAEQICHHPPITAFKLKGPTFELYTDEGFNYHSVKFGFNNIRFNFESILHFKTISGISFTFNFPAIKGDNIIWGKRSAGMEGDVWIEDSQGYKFKGTVVKPLKLKGTFYDTDGGIMEVCEGNIGTSVKLKRRKCDWFAPLNFKKLDITVPTEYLNDELYSPNVWAKVFEPMRLNPPDFKTADKEKHILEEAQRAKAKLPDAVKVVSRFGFVYNREQ